MKKCTCGANHTSNPKHHSEWCDCYENNQEVALEYLHNYLVELKKKYPSLAEVVVSYPLLEYSRRLMGEFRGTCMFIHYSTQLRLLLKNETYVNWTRLDIDDLIIFMNTKEVRNYKY